jgi:hypothetical protein
MLHDRQVADDVARSRDLGVTELILDLQATSRTVDELLDAAAELTADHSVDHSVDQPADLPIKRPGLARV